MGRVTRTVLAAAVAVGFVTAPRPAPAMLSTPGFRAVGVAHSAYPLSALAVAPDGWLFATVQALGQTTGATPGSAEIRVYTNYTTGVGEYLGTDATSLEPLTGQTAWSGGPVVFGVDGCVYAGVGDSGSGNRWDAQLLIGADASQGSESRGLCTNVCLGPTLYPA